MQKIRVKLAGLTRRRGEVPEGVGAEDTTKLAGPTRRRGKIPEDVRTEDTREVSRADATTR